MRLHRVVASTVLRTLAGLFALALPLAVMAQTTRLLPLLIAAAPAYRATAILAGGGVALIATTLTPPLLAVSVALTLARMNTEGSVRVLASHGVSAAHLMAVLRPLLMVIAVGVLTAGVFGEPPVARAMRGAAGTLCVRGLAGTLRRGGQVEPLPGLVLAAPQGALGPLYMAYVSTVGEAPATLRANHFAIGETPARRLSLRLTGVTGERTNGERVRAKEVTLSLPRPAPPEDVVARDLTDSVAIQTLGPTRRHAARVLWGVLTYAVGMLAAALALRSWRGAAWGVALSAVLPVGALVAAARLGALAGEAAHTSGGVWKNEAWLMLGVMFATESAVLSVARRPRRVL